MTVSSDPLIAFRFRVSFSDASPDGMGGYRSDLGESRPSLPELGFSECTGLEATMEPKVIKEGGRNYGPVQLAGPVSFGTVVLKRGLLRHLGLWRWFTEASSQGRYGRRRDVVISLRTPAGDDAVISWQLKRALPIKFKAADLNARGSEVGVEELHLAHEGLRAILGAPGSS